MNERSVKDRTAEIYRQRARNYDLTANLYYLIGLREWSQRREAVERLALRPGDTVVEIGCGTGLNFGLLLQRIGPGGRIIGVDLTDAMLEQARRRVEREGWRNVELVRSDAASYRFPPGVAGVLSTYALSLVPECGQIIARASQALQAGGRMVILDLQVPDRMPAWLISLLLPLIGPFMDTGEWRARRPWETIRRTAERHFDRVSSRALYLGLIYILCGERQEFPATEAQADPPAAARRKKNS